MSELLTNTVTKAEQNGANQQQRGINNFVYDVENLRLADIGDTFKSRYDLFWNFFIEYSGKKIEDYLWTKKGREGVEPYKTARFPEADKDNMMYELELMFDIDNEIINAKTSQFRIVAIHYDVIERKIEKMLKRTSKAA